MLRIQKSDSKQSAKCYQTPNAPKVYPLSSSQRSNAHSTSMYYMIGIFFMTFSVIRVNKTVFRFQQFESMHWLISDDSKSYYTRKANKKCQFQDYTQGYWNRTGRYINLGEAGKYTPRSSKSERERALEASRWDWITECALEPFDREKFCSILGNRSILFVGDSITHLQAKSLYSLLVPEDGTNFEQLTFPGAWNVGEPNDATTTRTVCNNVSLSYARNDFLRLSNRTYNYKSPGHRGKGVPWRRHLNSHQILVLNTGAHFSHDKSIPEIEELLYNVSKFLERHYTGTVIYRTTARGHLGCAANSTVLDNSIDLESSTYMQSTELYRRYAYGKFNQYDNIAKTFFRTILDVVPMTELRPDGHLKPPVDCLHYLLPGPVDHWNWLLYNMLLGIIS